MPLARTGLALMLLAGALPWAGMSSAALKPLVLTVPCGAKPVTDGAIGYGEWRGSSQVRVGAGARLLARGSETDIYLAVRLPRDSYRYLDIYVRDATGRLLNLHASMQYGERLLAENWSDDAPPFVWRPASWVSSVARRTGAPRDAPIAKQIVPLKGYEMRIPKAHLGQPPLRIRVELRDFAGEAADWVFPSDSERREPLGWGLLGESSGCR